MKYILLALTLVVLASPVEAKTISVRHIIHVKTAPVKTEPGGSSLPHMSTARPSDGGSSARFVSESLAKIPNSEDWRVISKYPHRQVIAAIYEHESTFGKYDACRSRGMFNGFGWKESDSYIREHGPRCFPTLDAVVSEINNWIQDKIDHGMSYNQINCLYVVGVKAESCKSGYKLKSERG